MRHTASQLSWRQRAAYDEHRGVAICGDEAPYRSGKKIQEGRERNYSDLEDAARRRAEPPEAQRTAPLNPDLRWHRIQQRHSCRHTAGAVGCMMTMIHDTTSRDEDRARPRGDALDAVKVLRGWDRQVRRTESALQQLHRGDISIRG